jgi:hypothetical protein
MSNLMMEAEEIPETLVFNSAFTHGISGIILVHLFVVRN